MKSCTANKPLSHCMIMTSTGSCSLRQLLQRPSCLRQFRHSVLAKASAADQQEGDARKPARRLSSIDAEKEESRRYRRTTYSFDDWKNHRSTTRYWRHIKSGFVQSRIVKGLAAPLTYVALLSAAVCFYEAALAAHTLPDWGFQWPSISMNSSGPFSLSTFALSLLLVFRTNSSYQRWAEARRMWGLLINRSRDLARQVTQWVPLSTDAALVAAACRWIMAFPIVLMASLRDDVQMRPLLEPLLLPHELEMLMKQPHPGSAALQVLGALVKNSSANRNEKLRIDENITVLQDVMGVCERIFRTPIPLSYTRHTSRFLVCWVTCLPFCVADSMGWMTVPIAVGLAFFLFGIEEIGVQIEEPFGILALEVFCASIIRNVRQAESAAAAAVQNAVDLDVLAATAQLRSIPVALETICPAAEPIGSSKYDIIEPQVGYRIHPSIMLTDADPAAAATGLGVGGPRQSQHSADVQGLAVTAGAGGDHDVGGKQGYNMGQLQAKKRDYVDVDYDVHGRPSTNSTSSSSSSSELSSSNQGSNDASNGSSNGSSTYSSYNETHPLTNPIRYPMKPKLGASDVVQQHWPEARRAHRASSSTTRSRSVPVKRGDQRDLGETESSYELKGCDSGDDVYLGMSIGAAAASVTPDESQEPGL